MIRKTSAAIEKQGQTGEWMEVVLGDIVEIRHGFAFKGEFIHDEPQGDVLLTPGNFAIGGGFKADKFKYYDGPVPDDYILRKGDLIVSMTDLSKQADTLGYPALIPLRNDARRYLHNQRLGKIIIKERQSLNLQYLHYLLCSQEYRHEVLASATGTTVKHTSPTRISAFRFNLPPLKEQKAIAHVLGTLDDKIELNRKMNETLEAMARALFKSWFVDFDPIHAKAEGRQPAAMDAATASLFPDSFEPSPLGPIPKGWEVGTLGNVAENPRRGVQPSEIEASTPYIALEHMPRRCIALSDWQTADSLESNKFEFNKGEILFGKLRPYFHKVGVAPVDGVCSTDIVVVAPSSDKWFGFVLGHTSSDAFIEHTNASSTGTRMPRTSWGDMARYPIALPPDAISTGFEGHIRPSITRMLATIHESRALAALRDALLPKLLSGELRISEAEKLLEIAI